MKQIFFLLLAISVLILNCVSEHFDFEWGIFKNAHSKHYPTQLEENLRKAIFISNIKHIIRHNLLFYQGLETFSMGVNEYADLLPKEFSYLMNGLENPLNITWNAYRLPKGRKLPAVVNWVRKGAVTGVKDQGRCGSCYAFSAVGAIESQLFLKTGKLIPLSEQNVVDCSTGFGNFGCHGGLMTYSFDAIIAKGGINKESSYPYEAKLGICRYDPLHPETTISGYFNLPSGDELALQDVVANYGPVSVGIDARGLQFYHDGIYYNKLCSSTSLNHGVLAVGYGSGEDRDYWLVKNSWGERWGQQGYVKMARNADNHCGIATMATIPYI